MDRLVHESKGFEARNRLVQPDLPMAVRAVFGLTPAQHQSGERLGGAFEGVWLQRRTR